MLKKSFFKELNFEIEEFILLSIILLNILDVAQLLGPTLDYIKKIISWTALGYIIYTAKPSKLFIGVYRKKLDLIFIAACFLLIIKNLIAHAFIAQRNNFLDPLYTFITVNATIIELTGIYLGLFLFLVYTINLFLGSQIKAPSILHTIHADKNHHRSIQFISLFLIVLSFFLIVFNLLVEWLAIAIDAPLLLTGLVIYFFFIIKQKKHFKPTSFLAKFGDFGSDFYEQLVEHLRYKKSIFRILAGVLVLHTITDAFSIIWPYLFGTASIYTEYLGQNTSLLAQLGADLSLTNPINYLSVIVGHTANIIAIIFFLLSPAILWYALYKKKKIQTNKILEKIVTFSVFTFLLVPTFSIKQLQNNNIFGVGIIPNSIFEFQKIPLNISLLFALIATLALIYFSKKIQNKEVFIQINTVFSKVFFSIYVILFFLSVMTYYIVILQLALMTQKWFLLILFALFMIITAGFYIISLRAYIVDVNKHITKYVK